MADLEYLKQDFDETQKFYDERIHKIKDDSVMYFNKFSIKQEVVDYSLAHPERVVKTIFEPLVSDD